MRGGNIGMPQHLADRFDRNTFTKGHCGCERVPREVERKVFLDLADVGYLFQIGIALLI